MIALSAPVFFSMPGSVPSKVAALIVIQLAPSLGCFSGAA
jgi:hypothetical protein